MGTFPSGTSLRERVNFFPSGTVHNEDMLQLTPPCSLLGHVYCIGQNVLAKLFWVSRAMKGPKFLPRENSCEA